MSNVIAFKPRPNTAPNPMIIKKVVNGETVECVNFDALTPTQRARYFEEGKLGAPRLESHGAPHS
jgi:hypothetical protein